MTKKQDIAALADFRDAFHKLDSKQAVQAFYDLMNSSEGANIYLNLASDFSHALSILRNVFSVIDRKGISFRQTSMPDQIDEDKVELWPCQYLIRCKHGRGRTVATTIVRYVDAKGQPVRQIELCEHHTNEIVGKKSVRDMR